MQNFNLAKLENEAYSLTVNLFSFYKTLKENNIKINNSNEVLTIASEISTFVMNIDEEPCKYYNKLKSTQEKVKFCEEKIADYKLNEKYSSAQANLIVQLNSIKQQLKLLNN